MKKFIIPTIVSLILSAFAFSQEKQKPEVDSSNLGEKKKKVEVERPRFPTHWGRPPEIQLKDYRPLPGGFGMGSSTLAYWIKENIEEDAKKGKPEVDPKDPRNIEKETLQALKEGKISKEDAQKKLTSLRKEMAEKGDRKLPKRPQKPELSEEVKEKIAAVKEMEKSIHTEMKAKVEELGKDASREEIKTAVEAFKESNKERFEEIKEKHSSIRENMEANRPPKPERPELTAALKSKVDALKAKQKEMHEAQKKLHQSLKDASKDERKEMITDFKEANKEKHEEIKTQAKEVKKEIRELVETDATRTSDL
jgi:DNA repair exonuclease SbcCD ATPase subunit|tara:strand:+ start:783 stop:1712 length:930 start_codon:yes stop_codon:yes gene_type:complete